MVSPKVQELARRLLVLEAACNPAPDGETHVAAQVIEGLRVRLVKLAGVDGFRSLLSRALTLAKADVPSLQTVSVSADGGLVGIDEMAQDGAVLVAHLLDLLINFIGELLTLQLVSGIWPGASADDVAVEERA